MLIIGHRGARGLAPENTIASIQKAMELNVDMVEFDVRVTPQGKAVLHHNKLPHETNQLDSLQSVLKAVNSKVPLYIEVKPGENIQPVIADLQTYKGKFWLASKNQKTLRQLHQAMPQVPKIVIEPWSGVRASRRAKQVNTKIISMNQRWLWSGFIKMMSKNYQLYAYTINNPAKAKRWQKYGLAGVVTDRPDLFEDF